MAEAKLAFIFPGQGSQRVGMLGAARARFPVVGQTFDEASAALDIDLWELVARGPQETLNLTQNTQPVLLACSVALWRAWQAAGGPPPATMAGHSLGEFSALVCAGSLSLPDAVRLVRRRGEFMQSAVPVGEGAMAAIFGLDDERIVEICRDVSGAQSGVVAAVNFNSPGQVVIAGHTAPVQTAIEALQEAGAKKAVPLPVSAPFHTQLMEPAGEQLAGELAAIDLRPPQVPVIHNVHASAESDPEKIRQLLVEQIYRPVQWTQCVQAMRKRDVDTMVECGPGAVLSGLNRRIDRAISSFQIEEPDALVAAVAAVGARTGGERK